jgi:hypothetical protein
MTEQVACLNVAIPCPHVLQQDEGSLLSLLRPRGEAYEKKLLLVLQLSAYLVVSTIGICADSCKLIRRSMRRSI